MKLIVGLGNPGAQYEKTRHNAGFMAVDALARKHAPGQIPRSRFQSVTLDASIGGEKSLLLKPAVYMNRSGQSVGEAVRFFKLDPGEDMIVLVDDIALPVGHIRVRQRGGAGGHNGLGDIDRILGGEDYTRIRIGVGNVPRLMDQADWVLSRFMSEEHDDVIRSINAAADATEMVIAHGINRAMNTFNTRLVKAGPDKADPGKAGPDETPADENNKGPERSGQDTRNQSAQES